MGKAERKSCANRSNVFERYHEPEVDWEGTDNEALGAAQLGRRWKGLA